MFGFINDIIWFDMFEYIDWMVVFKLIGIIVGYVGYDDNFNILIEKVWCYLYLIVLFDEIEKVNL